MAQLTAITVNGQSLPVREYEGNRVVTLNDIARVHGVKPKNIDNNFNRNRQHFIKGEDYFYLKGDDVSLIFREGQHKINHINAFTESGYLMLVKSLTDDLSWQVQRLLVNNYFKVQEIKKVYAQKKPIVDLVSLYPLLEEVYKQVLYYRLEKGLTQEETARILGVGIKAIYTRESELRAVGISLPQQRRNGAKYQLTALKLLAEVK